MLPNRKGANVRMHHIYHYFRWLASFIFKGLARHKAIVVSAPCRTRLALHLSLAVMAQNLYPPTGESAQTELCLQENSDGSSL